MIYNLFVKCTDGLNYNPTFQIIITVHVRIVCPAPKDTTVLCGVIEHLRSIKVTVVIPEAKLIVLELGVRDVLVRVIALSSNGVVLIPFQIKAHLEHISNLLGKSSIPKLSIANPILVMAATSNDCHMVEIWAFPHPRHTGVQPVVGFDTSLKVPAPVKSREALLIGFASDDHLPLSTT
jgi:hypothetical protein